MRSMDVDSTHSDDVVNGLLAPAIRLRLAAVLTGMRRLMAVLVVLVLFTTGCGGSDDDEGGSAPPVSLAGPTSDHGTKAAAQDLEVELDDFYFGPTFIKATAGQRFTLRLKNEGKTPHTFSSTALGIDEELLPGESKTVTVTAPQTGNALVICRYHQAQGMQGAIFVA